MKGIPSLVTIQKVGTERNWRRILYDAFVLVSISVLAAVAVVDTTTSKKNIGYILHHRSMVTATTYHPKSMMIFGF